MKEELGVPEKAAKARVLILAPTANDARLTGEFLRDSGCETHECRDTSDLERQVDETCGCIIVAEETLRDDVVSVLMAALKRQPSWSDLPVIIITSGGEASRERLRRLALLGPGGNVNLLERPFRPDTLVSATAVALKARARQYQVRGLLSALSEARDEAEQASRAKDDFLATLSHELRTPLSPVLLLADAEANNPDLPDEVRAKFSIIRKNVNLEARLIDDLLDLTRISRGKLQLNRIRCNVHRIIEDAISNVQGDAHERGISMIEELTASDLEVLGDPVRLQQVIWNVLRNAVKFAPSKGVVNIRTRNADGTIQIDITDSGIGLAESELEHIFDAFSQSKLVRGSNQYGGLGLGLSIARMLVEIHSGTIQASSEGLGRGATFTINLPLLEASQEERHPSEIPEASVLGELKKPLRRRILLVEDHEDTLAAMSFLLGSKYEIVTAPTAREARSRATEGPFDLVISDIGLPDEKGYDLMAFLRDQYGLRGIALSGFGMEEDVMRSQQVGFVRHLTKPVEFGTLQRAIDEVFEETSQ